MKICFYGTYDRTFSSNTLVMRGLEENGVRVLEVNAHVPITRLDKKDDMGFLQLIKRVFRKLKLIPVTIKNLSTIRSCDVIYVGYPGHFDVIPAFIVAKLLRKKLIFNPLIIFYTGFVEEQGILDPNSILAKIILRCEGMMYKMCDLVLADTPRRKSQLIDLFGLDRDKISILPIGADDKIYVSKAKKKDGYFNAVYYGLFSPVHGVEYIIEAAQKLNKYPKIRFQLIGKGNKYDEIVSLAKKNKLKNVIFYPDLTEKNSLSYLQQADVFFGFLSDHPVVSQAIPNKVYQGLALGKTVVTAGSPVMRDVFSDRENIYFCKQASAQSVAESIEDLYLNPKLSENIGQNGYRLFQSNFRPKIVGKTLKEILEIKFQL